MNYSGADPITICQHEIKAKILVFPMFFFLPFADTLRHRGDERHRHQDPPAQAG